MKLDIGGGKKKKKGFHTIDIEPRHKTNFVGDFRKMSFENIEHIRSNFLLEHFRREEQIKVLQLWHSWLQKYGVLDISVPDFEYICKNFAIHPYWMTRHAFGSQEAGWAYHLDGWYEEKIRKLFPCVGFEIQFIERFTTRRYLPNIRVVAKKVEPKGLEEYIEIYPLCPNI
jgi:predicted SAM-dependent methyltransferase